MLRGGWLGLGPQQLRWGLGLFIVAVAIPTGLLIAQAYRELRWEAFHQLRLQAEELTARVDAALSGFVATEEARPFEDYAFRSDADPGLQQRSPLAAYPFTAPAPGVIGYFQVDPRGVVSSPLLPERAASAPGMPPEQWRAREAVVNRLLQTLGENRLVNRGVAPAAAPSSAAAPMGRGQAAEDPPAAAERAADAFRAAPAAAPAGAEVQAAFDRLGVPAGDRDKRQQAKSGLAMGRVEDLRLDERYQRAEERRSRQDASPPAPAEVTREASQAPLRVQTFEREREPLALGLLDSGHFVLFRRVWRDGQRYVQGVLIEAQPFVRGLIGTAFDRAPLARASSLIVAWQGDVFAAFAGQQGDRHVVGAEQFSGALIYRAALSSPLHEMALIYSVRQLPPGPGAAVIGWLAVVLAAVLLGGVLLMYRLGLRQIALVRQQQDFVSAVSHELKTPLTAIRMYAEMLQQGWASTAQQADYYDYIHSESERLSRLIDNVLQLARMTRNDLPLDLKPWVAAALLEGVRQKLAVPVERAGFTLLLDCGVGGESAVIIADADYLTQIVTNLVDNAVKFAARAQRREIELGCRLQRDGRVVLSVRDYGPGVARDQVTRVFQPFFRAGDELTRETAGTGIGLGLVREMAQAMGAEADVVNREPGAEFRVIFRQAGPRQGLAGAMPRRCRGRRAAG